MSMTFLDCTCVPENLGQGECPVHQKELREMEVDRLRAWYKSQASDPWGLKDIPLSDWEDYLYD